MDDLIPKVAPADLSMIRDVTEPGRGLVPSTDSLTRLEQRFQSAGRFGLPLSIDSVGTVADCPQCRQPRQLRETAPNAVNRQIRYWSDCACVEAARARSIALSAHASAAIRGTRDEFDSGGAYDVETLAAASTQTFATYHADWLTDPAPYHAAVKWLADIEAAQVVSGYRVGPPAALYFRGLRGRGKTHLAIALLLSARGAGRRVAILNETKYLHQTRSVDFGEPYERLLAEPGERAWLTLFDDIGKYKPTSEADRARVQNAWYGVLDRRYNRRRYSIFTSEKTLEDLVKQGTLDDALYSRLYEMTRGIELPLCGADQRLRGAP
jgi:DNA replication protein DnaC